MKCILAVLMAVGSLLTPATAQPLWSDPFPYGAVYRAFAATTSSGGASVPAVLAMEAAAMSVLDAETGRRTHRFNFSSSAQPLSPAVVGANVGWRFHAWSTATGALLWSAAQSVPSTFPSDVLTVMRVSTNAGPYALEIRRTTTGKVLVRAPASIQAAAAVAGASAVVFRTSESATTGTAEFYRLDKEVLAQQWAVKLPFTVGQDGLHPGPVDPSTGAMAYVVVKELNTHRRWAMDTQGHIMPLPPASAFPLTESAVASLTHPGPGQSGNMTVTVTNVTTKSVAWTLSLSRYANVVPLGDVLLVLANGEVSAVGAATGTTLWSKMSFVGRAESFGPHAIAVSLPGGVLQVWSRKTGAVISKTDRIPNTVFVVVDPALPVVVAGLSDALSAYKFL